MPQRKLSDFFPMLFSSLKILIGAVSSASHVTLWCLLSSPSFREQFVRKIYGAIKVD
jgi:hypothetical protein